MRRRSVHSLFVLTAGVLALSVLPSAATADDGGGSRADVRVERRCTDGSRIRLRVRTEQGDLLRVLLDVETARAGARWVVVVVHERHLVLRTVRRAGLRSRALALRLVVPDWPGRDAVVARALGPRGQLCRAAVTLPGP